MQTSPGSCSQSNNSNMLVFSRFLFSNLHFIQCCVYSDMIDFTLDLTAEDTPTILVSFATNFTKGFITMYSTCFNDHIFESGSTARQDKTIGWR